MDWRSRGMTGKGVVARDTESFTQIARAQNCELQIGKIWLANSGDETPFFFVVIVVVVVVVAV